MDRRLTPFSGRVALEGANGVPPDAPRVPGKAARVAVPLAMLRAGPGGAVDRQLIYGAAVTVIDRDGDVAFVQASRDGYCGWLRAEHLGPPQGATHRVHVPASHIYAGPKVQADPVMPLYMNAILSVTAIEGAWARTELGFVPLPALAPIDQPEEDPVRVAERLLHAPYLWAGNSVAGVDCSGLVQLSFHAAGRDMPGDSDLQARMGREIPPDAPLQRGDLVFWKGHVALMVAPDRILHANGHSMSVAYEDLAMAEARILAQQGGPVTARRRL